MAIELTTTSDFEKQQIRHALKAVGVYEPIQGTYSIYGPIVTSGTVTITGGPGQDTGLNIPNGQINIGYSAPLYGNVTDGATIFFNETGVDQGELIIQTRDNANEPIVLRQTAPGVTKESFVIGSNNNVGINVSNGARSFSSELTVFGSVTSTNTIGAKVLTIVDAISTKNHYTSKEWSDAYDSINGIPVLQRERLSINKTGSYLYSPIVYLVPDNYVFLGDDDLYSKSGKTIVEFVYRETSFFNGISSISFPDLFSFQSQISLSVTPNLLNVSMPVLEHGRGSLTISTANALTGVFCPVLSAITGTISLNSCPNLTTVDFQRLQIVGGSIQFQTLGSLQNISSLNPKTVIGTVIMNNCGFTTVNMSNLTFVGGQLQLANNTIMNNMTFNSLERVGSSLFFSNNASTSLNFPALIEVGGSLQINNMFNLTSMSFPVLRQAASIFITAFNNLNLNTLSFNSLERAEGQISIFNQPLLTTINLPAVGTWKRMNGNLDLRLCPFSTSTVDNILAHLAYMDGANGTLNFGSGRTVNFTGSGAIPSNFGIVFTPGSNFVCNGSVCTVNLNNHGYSNGDMLQVSNVEVALSANRFASVNVVNPNQFTYSIAPMAPVDTTGAGTARIVKHGDSVKILVNRGVNLLLD